MKLIIEPLLY